MRRFTLGIQSGGMHYFGDLSENLKTLALTRLGISAFGTYQLNDNISLRVGLLRGSVQGDDRMGNLSMQNWKRSLSFRTSITEVSVIGLVYLLDGKRQVRPYALGGLAYFRFNPKGDLFLGSQHIDNRYIYHPDGNITNIYGELVEKDGVFETHLHSWKTEGSEQTMVRKSSQYRRMQFAIPLGLGMKVSLSPRVDISFELCMRYLFTDYLDDVSSRYSSDLVTEQNFDTDTERALAKYISNPGGRTEAIRGNELKNDVYVFSSVGLSYKLGKTIIPKTFIFEPYRSDYRETWAFGIGAGMLFLHGDMRDHKFAPTTVNRGFPNRSDLQGGGSLYVTHYLSPLFGLKGEIISGSLVSTRQPEFVATPVMDASMSLLLNITNSFPRYKPYARKVDLYAQAGFGRALTIGSVRRVEDGETVRYTGPKGHTVLPVGGGVRIHLSKNVDLDMNYTYRYANTDLLDATRSGEDRPLVNTVNDGYSWLNISIAWVLLKAREKPVDPFRGIKKRVFRDLTRDSDQDGVPDYKDEDPHTLPGIAVDVKGKPLDRDQDGVPDIQDSDPFTPKGLRVNSQGMPSDRDGDGVPDYRDLEPESPRGSLVNFKGQSFVNEEEEENPELEIEALRPLLSTWNFLMVYFDFDKSIVKNEFYAPLSQLALLLEKMPELSVKLIGHADIRGNREYNLKLSERRAKAVIDALQGSFGIDPERFIVEAQGKDKPHTQYISKAAQGSNRRVEIRLMYKGREITEPGN